MPQGYLVSLADTFLGAGDDVAGTLTSFTTSQTLGTGAWLYTGDRIDGPATTPETNVSDTGTYYLGTDNNVYFIPDNDFIASGSGTVIDAPDFQNENVVSGTTGAETIDAAYVGDPEGNLVDGADGINDIIDAQAGNDSISAGLGNDTIFAGDGLDTVFAGTGNDVIYGDLSAEGDYTTVSITIDNFSFEATDHDDGDFSLGVPDWTVIGSDTGDWQPTSSSIDLSTVTGENVAYLYDDGDILRQTVSATYDSTYTYEFFFDLGDSYEGSSDYTVNIRAGGTVIGTISGETGDEDRLDATSVSSEGFSDSSLDGQNISIEFIKNDGGILNVDNVRGEFRIPTDPGSGAGGLDEIYGEGGNDTIFAGRGNDTIDGGSGDDLIFADQTGGPDTVATPITIDNSSFETTDHNDGNFDTNIPDWDSTGLSGDWNPSDSSLDESSITGENVAWIFSDGGTISQPLSQTYDSENTYQFTFDIGDSVGNNANYTVNILAGSTIIGSVTADTGDIDRLEAQFVTSAGFNDPQLDGQAITLQFIKNSGDELTFDNVQGEVLSPVDPNAGVGGNDDVLGGDGNDTIDAGIGDDTVDGGADDDTIIMSAGSDQIDGGTGTDTYDATGGIGGTGETNDVSIAGTGVSSRSGTVSKSVDGGTDTLQSIEQVIAGEDPAEADSIAVTGLIDYMEVSGLSDSAIGVFIPTYGNSGPIAFGGTGQPTINEILSFSYDPGTGPVFPAGDYQISSGDESGTIGDITFQNFENIDSSTTCFAPGTLIDTPQDPRKIETLSPGDLVQTLDGSACPIRWVHSSDTPIEGGDDDFPVLIKAGSLGAGQPASDLIVSPQHRILVGEQGQLEDCFDAPALVPAKALAGLNGIRQMRGKSKITWWHFACDTHEVIRANGACAESLLIGKMVLNGLSWPDRIRLHQLFGLITEEDGALNGEPARPLMGVTTAHEQIETARLGVRFQIGWHPKDGTRTSMIRYSRSAQVGQIFSRSAA